MTAPRYAVYWAPEPEHPLWEAGCAWLGRDPTQADAGTPPPHRAAPWRYGFHATLKAPMSLADGATLPALADAVGRVAASHAAFTLPPLAVATLGRFVALRPSAHPPALQRLADDCVTRLDPLRRAPREDELARRAEGLDDEQRTLLQRWGYPHVLQRWRFHLTLSDDFGDGLDDDVAREDLRLHAARWFRDALQVPLQVRSVCVFEEPEPGAPLRLVLRCPLG